MHWNLLIMLYPCLHFWIVPILTDFGKVFYTGNEPMAPTALYAAAVGTTTRTTARWRTGTTTTRTTGTTTTASASPLSQLKDYDGCLIIEPVCFPVLQ